MKLTFNIAIFLFVFSHAVAAAPNFELETSNVTKVIGCKNPKIQPGYGTPKTPLYVCLFSEEDYLEVLMNDDGKGGVRNIKFIWDDRTKAATPLTPPVHAKKAEAKKILDSILKLYVPDIRPQVIKEFFNNKKNSELNSASYKVELLYSKGPSIDERLLVLTPK